MPLTNYKGKSGNPIERIFWGKIPIANANAYFHYLPKNPYAQLITKLKYNGNSKIGVQLGRMMANDLKHTDFFRTIDAIIPVPLAKQRLKKRGYNQSLYIAKGVGQLTNIPISTSHIRRTINNPTQTKLAHNERSKNVEHIFELTQPCEPIPAPHNPDAQTTIHTNHPLQNKHILLIDDVITTGATLIACAQTLSQIPNIKISILCAAIAGHHGCGPKHPEEL